MFLCVGCAPRCGISWQNHKISVWSPGTGVKGGGELPDTGSGTRTGSSSETVCIINHCNTKRLKDFKKKKMPDIYDTINTSVTLQNSLFKIFKKISSHRKRHKIIDIQRSICYLWHNQVGYIPSMKA